MEPLVSSIEFSLSLAQSSEGCVNLGENRLQAERPATVTAAEWFVKPSPCFDHPQMGQGCHHLPMLNLVLLSLIWGSSNLECLASLQERATAATGLRFYPVSNPGACREPRCSVVFVCPLLLRGAHRHGGYGDTPHTSLSATSDPRTARFIEGILRCKGPARAMDQAPWSAGPGHGQGIHPPGRGGSGWWPQVFFDPPLLGVIFKGAEATSQRCI